MNEINTVEEFSMYAAQEFVQTAVFVDDRIFKEGIENSTPKEGVNDPNLRLSVSKSAPKKSQKNQIEIKDEQEEVDSPSDVVTGFAEKQIICSLYQPKSRSDYSEHSDIFQLCKAADIAIIDWNLHGDSGDKAQVLISQLIKQAVNDVPEQLRLILVYTSQPNLFEVTDQLIRSVKEEVGHESVEKDGDLAFISKNSRVTIFGKPSRIRPGISEDHVVQNKQLADVAIIQFAKLASGLLQAVTLLGLSEIKKNSRRLLSKFNASLDPAFLTHRALCLPMEGDFPHIVPLMVSEIEAVLEDALPEPLIRESVISDWCKNIWKPGDHVSEYLDKESIETEYTVAEKFCLNGFEWVRERMNEDPEVEEREIFRQVSEILLPKRGDNSNHRFARLMASRTFYENDKAKKLSLGSVLRCPKSKNCCPNGDKFFLCIQPECDTIIRFRKKRNFIFAELTKIHTIKGDSRISHVVGNSNDEFIELLYKPKSFKCQVFTFKPKGNSTIIQSEPSDEGRPIFKDESGQHYFWIDQLKMSHAQRAVEKFARDLSRVGLMESEWLRLLEREK